MHVEVQRAAEALDQRHRACLPVLARETGLADQVRGEAAMDDAEHRAHGRRLLGEQEPKRPGHAQHPLAHGLGREDLVDEERGALGHTPCATARTEATALAAEGNEVLGAAAVAGDAQETVLEPSAGRSRRRAVSANRRVGKRAFCATAIRVSRTNPCARRSFIDPVVFDASVPSPGRAQTALTSRRPSRATKSPGFLVYNDSPFANATAAMSRSSARAPRGLRPAAATAPYTRA